METKRPGQARRVHALHVVEAELEHLEWATRQPMIRALNASYWRRRLLAVQCGFALTHQQDLRIERILQRLGSETAE
ncbi:MULTISPECIES: hypothetical protein [Paraburkholderia]|uniref:Uncharacterized protein n=1 Tax=Paraburkholderia acidicola TaxID=1912599 RepID=A0A2A4F0G6_9BURK|nr:MULTISPECIES: hypothetical protein [Paraburkholderia]MCX4164451.1 hypothetical protein [Paraburkholderia megapolitana]MDN7159944.1 hypothetical protein [Paraburkholderia sp. CHISQ3]MDQ6496991.1 hypothetical protein [Paraburkholderia megapolitana]PCE26871.1 hypothetical protein BWP39_08780 [Paraburkholderia acidicola]